jgi:hypothetical protein
VVLFAIDGRGTGGGIEYGVFGGGEIHCIVVFWCRGVVSELGDGDWG